MSYLAWKPKESIASCTSKAFKRHGRLRNIIVVTSFSCAASVLLVPGWFVAAAPNMPMGNIGSSILR
eukprot:CAMPEP_0171189056 /NCGR_PEP_ID=MMETSP0790-20130122/18150_1 /TAXON_ID=2925 /ORGANISM="Alexandrium catenella, Strain OF101" /LENGTH=66 /DNA_ID=CAMNT_0011654157 /DNA_START=350 /DNA_END=550 /DNA_ORIENTATION=-